MVLRSSLLLHRIMRAVQITEFGGPEVCKVAQIAKPTAGPNQVVIKTKYAGINPVDTYIRAGLYAKKPSLPYTPGSDCSGTVEAVGDDVTLVKVGDPVFTVRTVTGACAEYAVADDVCTFPLNVDKMTYQQGLGLGVPYFTAYRALVMRGQAKAGETVLVHGASGGVGSMCVQLAKNMGLKVLATAGTEKGLAIVKDCGADSTFNHREAGYQQLIMTETGGNGVDIVIEMLANVNLQNDLEMMATHGRVVVIGSRGNVEINPRLTMAKESSVIGCMMWQTTQEEWKTMRQAVAQHQGESWLHPVIASTDEYTLDTVHKAHVDIMATSGASGNLVINTQS